MSKFTCEEKIEAVKRVVDEGMSHRESAKILGCDHAILELWVAIYLEFGPEGLLKTRYTYDGDFKIHVVEYMHANGLSYRSAAAKFGIKNPGNVAKWERVYYEEGPEALCIDRRGRPKKMRKEKNLDEKTKEDLIAEVQRLRMENEYLKKLRALVQERIARENGKEPPSSMN